MEGEIQAGPAMEAQEDSAEAQTGPEEAALEVRIRKGNAQRNLRQMRRKMRSSFQAKWRQAGLLQQLLQKK